MWKDFFYFSKNERRAILFVDFAFHIYVYMGSVSSKGRVFGTGSRGIEEIKTFWPEYMRWRRRNLCDIPMISLKKRGGIGCF